MGPMLILATGSSEQVSAIFSALADRRRRYALYALQETEKAISAETLAGEIAAMECDHSVTALPDDIQQEIQIELVHNHLPALSQANLIEYDHRSGDVCYRDPPHLLESCLHLAADRDLAE